MSNELDQLHKDDLMADLSIAFQQYGVRGVMQAFQQSYPLYYNEMEKYFNRSKDPQKIPVLLMKKD